MSRSTSEKHNDHDDPASARRRRFNRGHRARFHDMSRRHHGRPREHSRPYDGARPATGLSPNPAAAPDMDAKPAGGSIPRVVTASAGIIGGIGPASARPSIATGADSSASPRSQASNGAPGPRLDRARSADAGAAARRRARPRRAPDQRTRARERPRIASSDGAGTATFRGGPGSAVHRPAAAADSSRADRTSRCTSCDAGSGSSATTTT